jgi:hypothetical protein
VVLVQVPGEAFGSQYQIKRLRRQDNRWLLTSDNPAGPIVEPREDMAVIARLERVVRPEDLAPGIGTMVEEADLATCFGLDAVEPRSGRHGGHLFIFVDRKGLLDAPDRLRYLPTPPRPGETAFVLAKRENASWRYLGVARSGQQDAMWEFPPADFATWRAWGEGREVSHRIPEGALARAQLGVDAMLALPDGKRWLTQSGGGRARVLGAAQRGGLRVDGGEGGFAERTVSLQDLAWVIVADNDVRERGGLLDEARVNRLRYLEGTPKESTRWIDTGWALATWAATKGLIRDPVAGESALAYVHDDVGNKLDASFRVERVGDGFTIVFESRGGTRGTSGERNVDYGRGLELILQRLGDARLDIDDVLVESRDTALLPDDQRRVTVDGEPFPLKVGNAAALSRKLSAAQARVGRAPGAKGAGNRTKRLRIFIAAAKDQISTADFAYMLGRSR